jgi:acetyl esterase/lipase
MKSSRRVLALLLALLALPLFAAQPYPPAFEGVGAEVYKTVGDTKLSLYVFEPKDGPKENRPAIVFFFGGGWAHGSPVQFEQQCRYLASRGMVAITADYRVASRHQVKVDVCVADAKSALRFVRANARRLGIDPQRIAAGGGSAGGQLAAAAAANLGADAPTDDLKVSPIPTALVLFNPALALAPIAGLDTNGIETRMDATHTGADPRSLSPVHQVKKDLPPTIIFHGRMDTTVPFPTVEAYAKAMEEAGNRCELVVYNGQTHGFFNYGRGDNPYYKKTVAAMDAFLVSLGYLAPPPAGS